MRRAQARSRKRILIIVENLPVPLDRRVWNEATALQRAGYDVSVICPVGKGCEERTLELEGVAIFRHPLPLEGRGPLGYGLEYASALFWELLYTLRVFLTRGFDVIQACNPPDTIFIIGRMFRLFGKRFVFDHHDVNPELYLAKFNRKDFFYRLVLALERWTFRTATVSIATNESFRDVAIARGGMDPSRVFIVRSGPNVKKIQPVPPNETLKEGHRFAVGYVGVMGKQDGLDLLMDAIRHIVHTRKRNDVIFLIVGGGTELEPTRQLAKDYGITDHVRFTGWIADQTRVVEILSTADIGVAPDIANDMNDKSTMNKVLEYMALGKPIVQFDLLEGRRSAGEASLYARRNDPVDLGEKILGLLEDPERRRQMGDIGRRRIQTQFAWEFSEKILLEAYETACS